MKILFLGILIFLIPSFAFGATYYTRTPVGNSIFSPVSFYFSFDDWDTDMLPYSAGDYWSICVCPTLGFGCNLETGAVISEVFPSTTQSTTMIIPLSIGEYGAIMLNGFNEGNKNTYCGGGGTAEFPEGYLEGSEPAIGGVPIFTIIASPTPSAGLTFLPDDFIANIFNAIQGFISGFALPIELIFGIGVAMWGVSWISGEIRQRARKAFKG